MAEKWRIPKICKTCAYRTTNGGGMVARDWSNTNCNYNIETGILRESNPTDNHCDYYSSERRRVTYGEVSR